MKPTVVTWPLAGFPLFSQLRLGNHAKTCWPFHADFADSRRTLASRHVGQDRRSAAVLWFERLLLLCGV